MWLVDAEHDEQYGKPVNRYGHLMSFCVKGGAEADARVLRRPRSASGAPPIWAASRAWRRIPAISTHQQQGEEGRAMADIPPNMVRLCVGGEHPDDVIADLDQALGRIGGKASWPLAPSGHGLGVPVDGLEHLCEHPGRGDRRPCADPRTRSGMG